MASTIGRAVIEFVAETAKFEGDVGRAAVMFDKSMSKMGNAVTSLKSMLVTAAVSAGIGAFVKDAVAYRASLDDLAEITGDNVQMLDGLARQARISGVEFATLEGSMAKLAKNLNAADDEGKNAGAAMHALGLSVDEVKAKKPGEAMLEVAKALGQFEDGASKVAVAVALFGKEGAKLLPYLKDLAEAGEINGKVTAEQAAKAEALEKEWRKLQIAISDSKALIVDGLVPAMKDWLEQMNEGIRLAGSLGQAIMLFGTVNPFRSIQGNLEKYTQDLKELREARENLSSKPGYEAQVASIDADIKMAEKRIEFLKFMEEQNYRNGRGASMLRPGMTVDEWKEPGGGRGILNFDPDAQRKAKEAARLAKELADKEQKEAEYRSGKAVELEEMAMEDRIGASEALAKVAIANEKKRQQEIAETTKAMLESAQLEVEAAENLVYTWNAAGERVEMTREQFEELQKQTTLNEDIGKRLGMTFTSAFEDAVIAGKKLSDVIKGIGMDIARIIMRIAVTEPFAKAVMGSMGGVNWSGGLNSAGSWISSMLNGGGSGFSSGFSGTPEIPFLAEGGYLPPGRWGITGEEGPEPIFGGKSGVTVYPNESMGKGGGSVFNIDARGASVEAVARLEKMVVRLHGTVEKRAIHASDEHYKR